MIASRLKNRLLTQTSVIARWQRKPAWTSAGKDALVGSWATVSRTPMTVGHASRIAGLWVVRAPMVAPATMEPKMPTIEASHASKSKRPEPTRAAKTAKVKSAQQHAPTPAVAETNSGTPPARVTKHDRVLTLLSRAAGASIAEMMQATNWQQHSIRGFLAGTVRKKLGFKLTSSKVAGEPRRYRIETKRGR